jgi:hypothetical protein
VSETLDILRRQHQALADYEAERERRRGARQETERARVRPVVEAHRAAWLAAGGSEADFVLAPLLALSAVEGLGAKSAAELASKPPAEEPAPAERPKRRER